MRINGRMLLIAALVTMVGLAVVCTEASDNADAEIKTGSCGDNATYAYDSSDGSLTIEGTGKMTDYTFSSNAPWYRYGAHIFSVTIGSGITYIGSYAFYNCNSLTSVTIPSSVTSIGGGAFFWCTSLTSVTIPSGVTSIGAGAFYNCTSLTSVTIPSGVTSIGSNVFRGCTSLTSVTIPSGVTSIGNDAFSNCTSLASVTMPSVTSIGNSAFRECTSLTSVTMPSVTTIGDDAFHYCISLTSVTIPSSVTSIIGWGVFSDCYRLAEVINNSSLNIVKGSDTFGYVAYYAIEVYKNTDTHQFQYTDGNGNTFTFMRDSEGGYHLVSGTGCSGSVILPMGFTHGGETVTGYKINQYAFYYCTSLTSLTIPSGVTSIGGSAFSNCTSLTSLTIPSGVTSIGGSAFSGCTSLTSLTIPSGVTSIGSYAFSGCTSLTSIDMPSVTSIGERAFHQCTALTSVTIPSSVTSIGGGAFYECYRLAEVINNSGLNIVKGSDTFGYVAYYAVEVYKNTDTYQFQYADGGGNTFIFMSDSEGGYHLVSGTGCSGVVTLPMDFTHGGDTVTAYKINAGAFYGCTSLTSVTIPSGVTSIGGSAFFNCISLASVTMPSVTSIGNDAFSYCTSLTSLTISSGVTSIGSSAFYGCTSLTSVIIPSSVTSIGYSAFHYCTSLTSVTIHSTVTSIGDGAFVLGYSKKPVICYVYGCSEGFLDRYTDTYTTFVYIIVKHSVTYDAAGGSAPAPVQEPVAEGESFAVAPYPGIRFGYEFGGWNDGTLTYDPGDGYVMGETDVVLTAVWNEIEPLAIECSDTEWFGSGDARITLSVASNPGISTLRLSIGYDGSVMRLKEVESSGLMDLTEVNIPKNPFIVYFETAEIGTDVTGTGPLVTLVFEVDPGAELGTYPVTVAGTESYRDSCTPVPIETEDGSLVIRTVPGDLNGDGKVNSLDSLLLRKYIANWKVTVVGNPDVNGDGKVTLADSLLLRMYIADWDVVLY